LRWKKKEKRARLRNWFCSPKGEKCLGEGCAEEVYPEKEKAGFLIKRHGRAGGCVLQEALALREKKRTGGVALGGNPFSWS